MARSITSPSVSTRKLITPCVDGCCGPMLSSIFEASCGEGSSVAISVLHRRVFGLGGRRFRHEVVERLELLLRIRPVVIDAVVLLGELVGLAQRPADPVLGEQDPPEI